MGSICDVQVPLRHAVEKLDIDDYVLHFWYKRLRQSSKGPWEPRGGTEGGASVVESEAAGRRMETTIRAQLLPWESSKHMGGKTQPPPATGKAGGASNRGTSSAAAAI